MLDPLDGTKEFIHERDEFTINLSLIEGRETIFSVIVVPCEQVVYLGYLKELPFNIALANNNGTNIKKSRIQHKHLYKLV